MNYLIETIEINRELDETLFKLENELAKLNKEGIFENEVLEPLDPKFLFEFIPTPIVGVTC